MAARRAVRTLMPPHASGVAAILPQGLRRRKARQVLRASDAHGTRRDEDQELLPIVGIGVVLEGPAEDGDVAEERDATVVPVEHVAEYAAEDEGLAVLDEDVRLRLAALLVRDAV